MEIKAIRKLNEEVELYKQAIEDAREALAEAEAWLADEEPAVYERPRLRVLRNEKTAE